MGMTRAWGSEEMEEEEKEKSEKMKSSFRDLVYEWVGPDLIWDTLNDWIEDYNSHAGQLAILSTIASDSLKMPTITKSSTFVC